MSELKLLTAWQKLADGPARVRLNPSSEIEYTTAAPKSRNNPFSSHGKVSGGEVEEIIVLAGATLYIRLASRVQAALLVDLTVEADSEQPAAS